MNEQKIAPIIVISCMAIVIITVLMYDNKQQQEIQTILESEEVSELEYPATLYQLPINKKVEEVVITPPPATQTAALLSNKKTTEEDNNTVSSPLPKKESTQADKREHVQSKKHPTSKNRYYVQIGAYKKHSGAKKRAAELTKAKWSVKIVRRKGLHLIWIGPLNTRNQAKRTQDKLLKNRFIKGFIVKR